MAQPGIAEPGWNGLNRGMAQAGMAEPEHTGTRTSHNSFGAQLNREGVQANRDTSESGHSCTGKRHSRPGMASPQPSLSDSGSPVVPVSMGDISKILWWGHLLLHLE